MPTYVCVVKAGLLNNLQKHRIAAAITRLHSETTGAPTWLVQVVIDENEQRQRYLSGQPADHQIWIRGDIRAGRTSEQRQRLMLGIVQAVSEISGVEESAIWVYLCNLAPDPSELAPHFQLHLDLVPATDGPMTLSTKLCSPLCPRAPLPRAALRAQLRRPVPRFPLRLPAALAIAGGSVVLDHDGRLAQGRSEASTANLQGWKCRVLYSHQTLYRARGKASVDP